MRRAEPKDVTRRPRAALHAWVISVVLHGVAFGVLVRVNADEDAGGDGRFGAPHAVRLRTEESSAAMTVDEAVRGAVEVPPAPELDVGDLLRPPSGEDSPESPDAIDDIRFFDPDRKMTEAMRFADPSERTPAQTLLDRYLATPGRVAAPPIARRPRPKPQREAAREAVGGGENGAAASAKEGPASVPSAAGPGVPSTANGSPESGQAASAGDGEGAGRRVRARPIRRLCPQPEFPDRLRGRPDEIRVLVRVTIDADGVVKSAVLSASSGHTDIDESALKAVKRWRFEPATLDGRPIESNALCPIVFVDPDARRSR